MGKNLGCFVSRLVGRRDGQPKRLIDTNRFLRAVAPPERILFHNSRSLFQVRFVLISNGYFDRHSAQRSFRSPYPNDVASLSIAAAYVDFSDFWSIQEVADGDILAGLW